MLLTHNLRRRFVGIAATKGHVKYERFEIFKTAGSITVCVTRYRCECGHECKSWSEYLSHQSFTSMGVK